jgi:Zn-dependent peptidase ImmA (M78 family)
MPEIEARKIADMIFEKFGTKDVFEIAEKARVKIVFERWFPATIGEFDRKNKLICVNLNASEKVEKIIAHELGHFFAHDFNFDKVEEERFARKFAQILIG